MSEETRLAALERRLTELAEQQAEMHGRLVQLERWRGSLEKLLRFLQGGLNDVWYGR